MNFSDPKLIRSLVLLSLFFLAGFLISWNVENYKREKVELIQDLTDQMKLATSSYQDSIVQRIFRVFDITTNRDGILHNHRDSLSVGSSLLQINHDSLHRRGSLSYELSVDSALGSWSTHNHEVADTSITVMFDTERDRKIIVWNTDIDDRSLNVRVRPEPIGGVDVSTSFLEDTVVLLNDHSAYLDSVSFIPQLYVKIDSIFRLNLKVMSINMGHELTIFDHPLDSVLLPEISIPLNYGNLTGHGRPYVIFDSYQGFLIKKMTSSILMSLVLFFVVLVSFLTILKSWMAQYKLTRIKNEFVSNMTHELKTPISTIGVALEAMENYGALQDPVKRMEYLEISKHEVNRLKILVDKVLKMSTLDTKDELSLVDKVNMKDLTDNMLKSMKLHLDKYQAVLDYAVSGEDFEVGGDKVHLTNVLYNLLDNAIKYSKEDPVISVNLISELSNVVIIVSDKGIGIPSDYRSKVFDRFVRVPTDDHHDVKGHGLGLHYVKTIIEKHNGSVHIESNPGGGSRLIVNLPKLND